MRVYALSFTDLLTVSFQHVALINTTPHVPEKSEHVDAHTQVKFLFVAKSHGEETITFSFAHADTLGITSQRVNIKVVNLAFKVSAGHGHSLIWSLMLPTGLVLFRGDPCAPNSSRLICNCTFTGIVFHLSFSKYLPIRAELFEFSTSNSAPVQKCVLLT